jgi:hypothetical protein
MPDSKTPLSFSGGNVIGTLIMELKMPYSSRIFQNGLPFLSSLTFGLPRGIEQLPIEMDLDEFSIFVEDSSGR